MRFANTLLKINAALFAVFGLGFIFTPVFFAQFLTGATPGTTSALIDMRATYGGISFGLALFWAYCARRTDTTATGVLSALLVLTVVAIARVIGLLIDGTPHAIMFVLLAAEVLFIGLNFSALRRVNHA